jgi:uncharacterized protein (TIGR02598 family)
MKIKHPYRRGFSLVEVVLALGIAVFCLFVIVGLLPVGLTSNQASINQTVAAGLAKEIISDLRVTPKTNPATNQKSPQYQITVPATGTSTSTLFLKQDTSAAGAENTDAIPATNPLYRATLVFTVPPAKTNYFGLVSNSATTGAATLVFVRLLITWPAVADKAALAAPKNYAGAYEVFVALDRS